MENTEQIFDQNILSSDVNDFNGVDDADDFYYDSEESNMNDDYQEEVSETSNLSVPNELDILNKEETEEVSNDEDTPFNLDNLQISSDSDSDSNDIEINNVFDNDVDMEISSSVDEQKPLDDSYVLSNFDVLFDSLYNDVNGANNFISDLIEQKKNVNVNEANLTDMKNKLEKEKEEFDKYVEAQKQSIELEKAQCNEYVKNQHIRLQNEEDQFNNECEATRAELSLEEEKIKIAKEELENEKVQFAKTREIEEEKIRTDRENLTIEKDQFEKEKEIALERIKQGQKELQSQKEQFAKTKELEEKKLELESKNLSQSCARFKELVSQFNSGFQQLPGDKD